MDICNGDLQRCEAIRNMVCGGIALQCRHGMVAVASLVFFATWVGGHSRPEFGLLSTMQWHHYDAAVAWDVQDRNNDLDGLVVETEGEDLA